MQLASTSTPRSATSSVTCSYDSGYRRYQRTHKTITSPGYWRPLNGLCGLIGMEFYPIRMPAPKFATEPLAAFECPRRDQLDPFAHQRKEKTRAPNRSLSGMGRLSQDSPAHPSSLRPLFAKRPPLSGGKQ